MALSRAITISAFLAMGRIGAAAAGEIRGAVHLEGAEPAPATVTIEAVSKDHPIEGCGERTKRSPRLIVDAQGGVQNAVVWIDAPLAADGAGPAPDENGVLDQRECVFEPHVVLLPLGGRLVIHNADPVVHNVRLFQDRQMLRHEWQPPRGAALSWRFETPGRFLVRCGVHPWMYAWVVVAPRGRAAVTDSAGRFLLKEIATGDYTLRVWHETLGERSQRVTVGQAAVTVRVAYTGGST